MADQYFTGAAPAVAQVTTVEVTAYDAATTYKVAVNQSYVTAVAEGSITATAAELADDWNASTSAELAQITASNSSGTITFTADTAGVPFTVTPSVSGGTGTIGSATAVTAASGPNFFTTAANWSGGTAPANSDTLTVAGDVPPIKYGLSTSLTGITLTIRDVSRDFQLGLPPVNSSSGYGEYPEYLTQSLTLDGATSITVDAPNCGLIRIATGSTSATLTCYATGTPVDDSIPALTWTGAHGSNVVNLFGGSVGLGVRPTETVTVATLRVGSNTSSNVGVEVGSGSTLTSVTVAGGTLESQSTAATLVVHGGTVVLRGAAASTTATVRANGVLKHQSSGTLATLNAGPTGTVDFKDDIRSRTVTTCNVYSGARIYDPLGTVTWTNGLAFSQAGLGDVTLDVGAGRTLKVS
jgi:hypothetical protein